MNQERILCLGVVALLLLGTGVAAAEEAGIGNAEATEALDVPITVVYRGYGFALKEEGGNSTCSGCISSG